MYMNKTNSCNTHTHTHTHTDCTETDNKLQSTNALSEPYYTYMHDWFIRWITSRLWISTLLKRGMPDFFILWRDGSQYIWKRKNRTDNLVSIKTFVPPAHEKETGCNDRWISHEHVPGLLTCSANVRNTVQKQLTTVHARTTLGILGSSFRWWFISRL